MIDLGKYALPVLLSYCATLLLLTGFLAVSIIDRRKTSKALKLLENAK